MVEKERTIKPIGRLVVDPQQCHGCQSCMVACSLVHERQSIPRLARIHIVLDPFLGDHAIHYCRQCRKAACASSCPQEAIRRDEATGFWYVDASLCTGCGACVEACPFDYLVLDAQTQKLLLCDRCRDQPWLDGQPACAASCPRGAIRWVTAEASSALSSSSCCGES